ncbi:unnamed protein product, partial [Mycena citricolor]
IFSGMTGHDVATPDSLTSKTWKAARERRDASRRESACRIGLGNTGLQARGMRKVGGSRSTTMSHGIVFPTRTKNRSNKAAEPCVVCA